MSPGFGKRIDYLYGEQGPGLASRSGLSADLDPYMLPRSNVRSRPTRCADQDQAGPVRSAHRSLRLSYRSWTAPTTPTVSTLVDRDWVDLSTVVEERQVRELIPRLYEAGAPGIIEVPIAKIIE